MATLTLTYDGKFKVVKTITIPDEHHKDYLDSHVERLGLQPAGVTRPSDEQIVRKHLDSIVKDIDKVFGAHVNRKVVNAYIATLPTTRLING
jgi:hypothetical protein